MWVSMRNSFPVQWAAWEKPKNHIATERGGGNRGDNFQSISRDELWEKDVREYDVRGLVIRNTIKWCLEKREHFNMISTHSFISKSLEAKMQRQTLQTEIMLAK